jgi:MerR family transcriptional regulator/heat shock protein HspR
MSDEIQKTNPIYSIGTMARLLGVSVHLLRLYEREGLILPAKSAGGQRLYSEEDRARLKCILDGIRVHRLSIAGIQRIQSLVPCWSVINCSDQDRSRCPAYSRASKPCWMLKGKDTTCGPKDCRLCDVYRGASDCESIKQLIVKATQHHGSPIAT